MSEKKLDTMLILLLFQLAFQKCITSASTKKFSRAQFFEQLGTTLSHKHTDCNNCTDVKICEEVMAIQI